MSDDCLFSCVNLVEVWQYIAYLTKTATYQMTADATFVTKQFYVKNPSRNLSTLQSQRFSIFGSQFLGEKATWIK